MAKSIMDSAKSDVPLSGALPRNPSRKPYVSPRLQVLGSVADLTLDNATTGPDGVLGRTRKNNG